MKLIKSKMPLILKTVAPFAGAWIEISLIPSLKKYWIVAPFAGAWIEISVSTDIPVSCAVAPFAGAWIEIKDIDIVLSSIGVSLPSRERGLKCGMMAGGQAQQNSRSLRGSVD